MKKIKLILFSLTVAGCTKYNCIQATPTFPTSNTSNCPSKEQLCRIYNKTQTNTFNLKKQNGLAKPKTIINQTVVYITSKPICKCNKLPMFPANYANYFVTYEPINDYPITYRAKYIKSCTCY